MACALEFISIDLALVQDYFAKGDSNVHKILVFKGAEIYSGAQDEEEAREEQLIWKEIVDSLNGGNIGKYLAAQSHFGEFTAQNDFISAMKAFVIASVVRHFGTSIAAVFHSMNAGEIFRSEPFEYINQAAFLSSTDAFRLLERPFFNQTTPSLPSFGGLTRAELAGISPETLTAAVPDSGDTDVNAWTGNILNLVEEARYRELDLVTIYE